jgi:large subunit ribosomal protein L5
MNSFQILYKTTLKKKLIEELNYKNEYQIPKIEKIIISSGLGLRTEKNFLLEKEIEDLRIISAQHPLQTKAKKSISEFGIKKGAILGIFVTLRREKMYTFLEKLIKLYLPRIRDFKGLSCKHFDKNGNYNLGVSDKTIFPELDYVTNIKTGYTITIVIKSKGIKESYILLKEFGFPFKDYP